MEKESITSTTYIVQKLIQNKWYDVYEHSDKITVLMFKNKYLAMTGEDYRMIKRVDEIV